MFINITTGGTTWQPQAPIRAPWICSRCGTSHAPHVDQCYCTPNPPLLPYAPNPYVPVVQPDCGCTGLVCQSTACPRRARVVSNG